MQNIANDDSLNTTLFGGDKELVNLKMFRGDEVDVSEPELRDEANFAFKLIDNEMCETHTEFPEDRTAKKTEIKDFVNI